MHQDSFCQISPLLPPPLAWWSPGAAGAAPAVVEESARAAKPDASVASPLATAVAAAVGPAEEGILAGRLPDGKI